MATALSARKFFDTTSPKHVKKQALEDHYEVQEAFKRRGPAGSLFHVNPPGSTILSVGGDQDADPRRKIKVVDAASCRGWGGDRRCGGD
jgi:hypothetical protein